MRDLAASGIPAEVSLQVLDLGRSPYYRWLRAPVTDSELREAYLANAIHDAHSDDPEFGYRFLFDEITDAGHEVSERTVWRICSNNGWWSVFGKKKRGKKGKVGAPAHDDLVRRDFTAPGPNRLWLTDFQCRRRHCTSVTQVRFGAAAVKSRSSRSPARVPSLAGIVVRMPLSRRTPESPRVRIARSTDPADASGMTVRRR